MPRQKTTLTMARIQLAIAKCQRTTSIANLVRECIRFARFTGIAFLCWMGGVVSLPAEEIDGQPQKVVAFSTVPDRVLDVDRG